MRGNDNQEKRSLTFVGFCSVLKVSRRQAIVLAAAFSFGSANKRGISFSYASANCAFEMMRHPLREFL